MNNSKPFFRLVSIFVLCLAVVAAPFQRPVLRTAARRRQSQRRATSTDYSAQLAAIEKTIDEKRKELGIPGISLAIVKDDQIIYLKGLGYKNFEQKIPVTPDTRFAIGSASKAFTAMLVAMSADKASCRSMIRRRSFFPTSLSKIPTLRRRSRCAICWRIVPV